MTTKGQLQGRPVQPPAHIALQPICDRDFRHRTDALLYRHSATAQQAVIIDPTHATASAVLLAIYEIGITQLVGDRDLLIKAPLTWLTDSDLLPTADAQLVLEINASDQPEPGLLNQLALAGYRLCLSCEDWPLNDDISVFEAVKIPAAIVEHEETRLSVLKKRLPNLTFIAHRVADLDQFDRCRNAGFDRFQGFFYSAPTTLNKKSQQGNANRQILLRILQELHQAEPDVQKISSLLTQLPQATLLLLKRANSAGLARVRQIRNVSEALMRLGLADIKTLMASLLITDMGGCSGLLLPDILTRAAFCRAVSQSDSTLDVETAFSVGLLSQLPDMLGMSTNDMLQQLSVSDEIDLALRHRQGAYGRLLRLAEAYEAAELSPQNRDMIARLNHLYLHARAWTQALLNVL